MLPAVSVTKDEVASSRSPAHVDLESFQPPQQQPSTAPAAFPPRQGGPPPAGDPPWPPPAPVITRTAATPMATPHGSPQGSSNDFASAALSKNLRNTLTVDRLSPGGSSASSGTSRTRVSNAPTLNSRPPDTLARFGEGKEWGREGKKGLGKGGEGNGKEGNDLDGMEE